MHARAALGLTLALFLPATAQEPAPSPQATPPEVAPAAGTTARAWLAETIAAARRAKTLPDLLAPRALEATTGDRVTSLLCRGQETEQGIVWTFTGLQDEVTIRCTLTLDAEARLTAYALSEVEGAQEATISFTLTPEGLQPPSKDKPLPWNAECVAFDVLVCVLLSQPGVEVPAGLTVSLGGLTLLGDYHFKAEPLRVQAGEAGALQLVRKRVPFYTIGRDAEGRPTSLERATYPLKTALRWLTAAELAERFPQ